MFDDFWFGTFGMHFHIASITMYYVFTISLRMESTDSKILDPVRDNGTPRAYGVHNYPYFNDVGVVQVVETPSLSARSHSMQFLFCRTLLQLRLCSAYA